jgi:hypothetical protein
MVNHSSRCKVAIVVLILCLVSPCLVYVVSAQSPSVTAEASSSQLKVGDSLTVTVKISDAVDLYGLDVTLSWNGAILEAVSAASALGVESNPNGVLHESSANPISVEEDSVNAGQYHLLATSTGSSTPSFSGSGTIATIEFTVAGSGSADLALDVELSTRDTAGEISLVTPTTTVTSVNTVIPEFPATALVLALAVAASAAVIITAKKLHKPQLGIARSATPKIQCLFALQLPPYHL